MFGIDKNKGKRGEPMPENNEGSPDSSRPSGLCPRCEKQSSFDVLGSIPLTFDGGYIIGYGSEPNTPTHQEQASVLLCRHCKQGISVLEEKWVGDHCASEGIKSGGTVWWKGYHWWPLCGANLHKSVPQPITDAYHEASLALSANCPRAAAVMARRTLEAIAADKGETSGTLAQQLDSMSKKGLLHPTLQEWAKEVRLIGNSGAHFDPINTVSTEDAKQLINFIKDLSNFLYVLPFELNERRGKQP